MRWTIRILAALAVLWAAYFAWPYFGLRSLVNAVQARDVAAINERVNFPALRQSLTDQIFRTYLRLTGREARLGAFAAAAVAASSSIADPIVARLVSVDVLLDLLAGGWPTAVIPDRIPGAAGLQSGSLGSVWQVIANSEHGIRTFALAIPANAPPAVQLTLRFRLTGGTWKLVGVGLPEELRVRLTRELIKMVEK
jgi:Protein of unknown function (DUF2939)